MLLLRILFAVAVLYAVFETGRHFPSSDSIVAHLQDNPALLLDHPELLDGARRLAKSQHEAQSRESRAIVLASQEAFLFDSPLATIVESRATPSTDIIEFVDYQCEPCKSSHFVIKRAQQENPGIRVVYQMLPVYGSLSEIAARMSLAAQRQGKFASFHQRVIELETALSLDVLGTIAEELGLDQEQLEVDMFSDETRGHIAKSKQLADELKVTGVPSFIVNGQLLTGGLDDEKLQAALKNRT